MIKKVIIILTYIFISYNSNLNASEKNVELKIGLLAPFSGEYKNLGNSLLLSVQLALDEIGDKNIKIIPRDSGSNNKKKLSIAVEEIINSGAKVIIGPTNFDDFEDLYKYKETIFISLSNKKPLIDKNIISIGISLESQLAALEKFIKKKKKNKTIIMYPKNEYSIFIDKKLKNLKLKNYKIFKYDPDPRVLTGEIEKLTNYNARKRNLEVKKNELKKKEDEKSKRKLAKLEQIYTLGNVNFDSIIIIDFGNSLKSVLASLIFSEVDDKKVLYTTINQWFDKSIFYENSVKNLYYPSINLKNFNKYNEMYSKTFNVQPNEITILAYDALGLIYYIWKKSNNNMSINSFLIKDKIKGKIGTFSFENGKVFQDLEIYKTGDKNFIKS
mgnify:CR=1 FL=1|tara:strand:- start:1747 stop:2901 length:1155 start_codon:yes stop_codon:yes gene_type:complete